MTIFVPDISHHQGDISIQGLVDAGAAALIARVGQGAGRRSNGNTYGTTRDRKWARNLAEAKRLGLTVVPYWYIGNLLSADENASLAAEWVGDTSLPWMLDHEDASGSIGFYRDVLNAFGRRGLRVVLSYIPQWYWAGVGQRASLAGLPPLVSSRYVTTSGPPAAIYPGDNGAGWAGYGDNGVALWQFTNKASMAGQLIDCSAYRGTRAQLAALLGGTTTPQEDDMPFTEQRIRELVYEGVSSLLVDGHAATTEGGKAAAHALRGILEGLKTDVGELAAQLAHPLADVLRERGVPGLSTEQLQDALRQVLEQTSLTVQGGSGS